MQRARAPPVARSHTSKYLPASSTSVCITMKSLLKAFTVHWAAPVCLPVICSHVSAASRRKKELLSLKAWDGRVSVCPNQDLLCTVKQAVTQTSCCRERVLYPKAVGFYKWTSHIVFDIEFAADHDQSVSKSEQGHLVWSSRLFSGILVFDGAEWSGTTVLGKVSSMMGN